MPFGKNQYVSALERRVVELEDFLTKRGLIEEVSAFTPYNFRDTRPISEIEDSSHASQKPLVPASRRKNSSFSEPDSKIIADRLLVGYMKHIATRYPVLHSAWIRDLHFRRASITNAYERGTLHLIYATAGRLLETTGETGRSYFPERHHTEVLKDLNEMLRYHDTRSNVTLLLLAVYSLRAEGGPGAWVYVDLAMVKHFLSLFIVTH